MNDQTAAPAEVPLMATPEARLAERIKRRLSTEAEGNVYRDRGGRWAYLDIAYVSLVIDEEAAAPAEGLDVARLAAAIVEVEEAHLNLDCLSDQCEHPEGECPEYAIGCGDGAEIAAAYAALAQPAAPAEGTDALPVDLSDYMAGYRQAQADLTGLDAAPAEGPTDD